MKNPLEELRSFIRNVVLTEVGMTPFRRRGRPPANKTPGLRRGVAKPRGRGSDWEPGSGRRYDVKNFEPPTPVQVEAIDMRKLEQLYQETEELADMLEGLVKTNRSKANYLAGKSLKRLWDAIKDEFGHIVAKHKVMYNEEPQELVQFRDKLASLITRINDMGF